ncbi:hypothetical protein F7R02_12910 [Xanthomonas cissicola]|nr:hypothetical protein F7R02_12910 [Xanthomonas cissicola]
MDEAKAVAAGYGERAPVNQEIPTESARNGEIPKIQTPLFGTTRHPALSGLVIQTFLNAAAWSLACMGAWLFSDRGKPNQLAARLRRNVLFGN